MYLHQQASSLFYEWVSVFNKNVSLIKSSFIVLSVLSINSIIGSDKQQTALLLKKYANFQKVIRCDTLEMLKDIFVNMIIDLSDFRSIKTSTKQDIVNKITDYISNHYMEQLSLSTVAKSVFLSPSYLSSLITGETGKNFTDIVNEIRISKSIELLKIRKCELLISPILLVLTSLSTLVVFLRNVQTSRLEIIVIFIYQVLLKENKILFVCARQRS